MKQTKRLTMNVFINIGNKETAIELLNQFKEKDYVPFDVRIMNTHITNLNVLVGKTIFRKDSLYINSHTLWELMQPLGKKGNHNYHDLTPEDIEDALSNIDNPYCIFLTKNSRYAIITTTLTHVNQPMFVVIEVGSDLLNKKNANIYKIVTMYPKSDFGETIAKLDPKNILYIKK